MPMANTLDYYNKNAGVYALSTVNCTMDGAIEEFLHVLGKKEGTILDFGCGSGRDSKVFWEKGYDVVSTDGSKEMCLEAEKLLSRPVQQMFFTELTDEDKYDGIWACASILHLPYDTLSAVLKKMAKALKPNGVIYASFRYGEMEGNRGERYFTDINEEKLKKLLENVNLECVKTWVTLDSRLDRAGDEWFNVILRKS